MPGDDRKWRELYARVRNMPSEMLKVGVFESAGSTEDGSLTMVELASIHEYGAPKAGIPERSFIRFTMENKKDEIKLKFDKLSKLFFEGRVTAEQMLNTLGAFVAVEIKRSITGRLIKQGLAESTIARKGHSVALIDTGRLLESITWKVEHGTH